VIRKPAVAGTFYPNDKEALNRQIDEFLDSVIVRDYGDPIGFVCPHAGYIYSGFTAAHAFKYLKGREYEKVVVLAPSHYDGYNGITTWSGNGIETPLGVIETTDNDKLFRYGVLESELGFGKEHSLEVELPFLQKVLKPGWKLVPLVMGFQGAETIRLGKNILEYYMNKKNLIIISSDLSHYHPYEKAKVIDGHFLNFIELDRIPDLVDAHDNGLVEACGFGPIMSFLKLGITPKVLDYRNSGDTAGDKSKVVGYTSIGAFWND
jgi:AmmeMemoRadiSam system protein B